MTKKQVLDTLKYFGMVEDDAEISDNIAENIKLANDIAECNDSDTIADFFTVIFTVLSKEGE